MTSRVIAVDVAILPSAPIGRLAIESSAALRREESQGLLLGSDDYIPHITLLQQFVSLDAMSAFLDCVGDVARTQHPIALRVTGGGMGSNSVWIEIERTPALADLHSRVLDAAFPFACARRGREAFFGNDARERDVQWVTGYRTSSSGPRFHPHITLGHAVRPPAIAPVDFEATTIAACHLGRFCSCRRVLRAWDVEPTPRLSPTPRPTPRPLT